MNRKCVDRLILFEEFTVDVFMLQFNFLIRHAIFSWQGVTRAVAPCSPAGADKDAQGEFRHIKFPVKLFQCTDFILHL